MLRLIFLYLAFSCSFNGSGFRFSFQYKSTDKCDHQPDRKKKKVLNFNKLLHGKYVPRFYFQKINSF